MCQGPLAWMLLAPHQAPWCWIAAVLVPACSWVHGCFPELSGVGGCPCWAVASAWRHRDAETHLHVIAATAGMDISLAGPRLPCGLTQGMATCRQQGQPPEGHTSLGAPPPWVLSVFCPTPEAFESTHPVSICAVCCFDPGQAVMGTDPGFLTRELSPCCLGQRPHEKASLLTHRPVQPASRGSL